MTPKVSFVLPAYKREYLHDAIKSILSQTYQDFELIICNDASPYKLNEVVELFHDDRIRYFENEKNLGGVNLTNSWNHALQYACADYVVLASDDDVYEPLYLEKMMELVNRYPKVDLFHCRLRYINENGEIQLFSQPALEYESCEDFIYQRLFYGRKQAAPEFLFRKSAIDAIGGFISFPLAWYSDDATWAALSSNGVCCVKEPLLNFRMSGINLSTKSIGVNLKVEALYKYKDWLKSFLSQRNPSNPNDRFILNSCKEKCDDILNYHIFQYLPQLPFFEFSKTLVVAKRKGVISNKTFLRQIIRRIL